MIEERKYILSGDGGRTDISLFGAVPEGSAVTFEISVLRCRGVSSPVMVIYSDDQAGEIKEKIVPLYWERLYFDRDVYSVDIELSGLTEELLSSSRGLLYYEYKMLSAEGEITAGGEAPTVLREDFDISKRQLLVYKRRRCTADIPDGIIYHIFVDRFKRSGKCKVKDGALLNENWDNGVPQFAEYPGAYIKNNEFFGGDLYGIIEKLPYIASLGTSIIYLSPIFDASSNHKYDAGNYMEVDSMFGGNDALASLCSEANKFGISIMLDGVFNHTGDDSVYFNRYGKYSNVGAYQSVTSEYYPWYNFINFPDEYECWWGIKILPRVKSDNKEFRRYICDNVVKHWMSLGVKSWRLDVVDELSDLFLNDFRKAVTQNSRGGMIIGEVWEDASNKISYGRRRKYFSDGQLDSVMNYPLRNAVISYVKYGDTDLLREATEGIYRRYPKEASDRLMNFLSTHDTERAISVFGDDEYKDLSNEELSTRKLSFDARVKASKLLCEAYAIIAALPGIPCVFYGDEIGMEGYRDPFCRRPFPWRGSEESVSATYRKIGAIRKSDHIFKEGYFRLLELDKEHISILRSPSPDSGLDYSLLAIVNNKDSYITVNLPRDGIDYDGVEYIGTVSIPPREWIYLKIKRT